jgi:DNA integrity scanning protein DisA with diadenylate cyclase activity
MKNNIKELGEEIKKVELEITNPLSEKGRPEQIQYIKMKLEECISNDNVIKALAIVDYVTHNYDISGQELLLTQSNDKNIPSICDIAYKTDHSDFAVEFSGFCQDLHYIDSN